VSARLKAGWALSVLGGLLVLWGVLHLTSAGYGTDPHRGFAERRPYNEVKRSVHAAVPGALLRAAAGGLAIAVGARLRRASGPR
jgi:hypothetical protein